MRIAAALFVLFIPAVFVGAEDDDADKSRKAIIRVLRRRGEDYDARIDVLERVRAGKHPDTVEICAVALRDVARPVRLIAAEILGRVREKRVVPILIDALAREKKVTVRKAIVSSLESITQVPWGDRTKAWKDWWKREGKRFRVPEPREEPKKKAKRAPAKGERRTVSAPRFYGIPVEAGDIVFAIDRSASMLRGSPTGSGNRWEAAVREMHAVVAKLPKEARVNVVLYAGEVWSWRESLTRMSDRNRKLLESDLRGQSPSGGTYLYDGLARALAEREVEVIYLLSDGEPSGGKFKTDSSILREVAKLNRYRRAVINVVAVGYHSSLLQKLASATGGRYVKK